MGACGKKKFRRKIDVKLILAFKSDHRRERRYYWCHLCKAYHLTSQEKRNAGKRDDSVAARDRREESH